jgi:hypothetical protein
VVAPAYVVRSAAIASLSLLLIGCSRPVDVQAPPIDESCEPILAAAPINILGELQRETTPADAAAIAWGDPPIVLVCGISIEVPADAQVVEVDGVAWVAQSTEAGTVFTTLDAVPALQVRVPVDYRPEIDVLSELGDVIANSVDAVGMS